MFSSRPQIVLYNSEVVGMVSLFGILDRRTVFWGSLTLFICATSLMAHNGPVGKHLLLFSLLYFASFILLYLLYRTFPDEWSVGGQLSLILCAAILCRCFFFEFPASYDVNRYIWEGYLVNQDINPYLHAPGDPVLNPLRIDIWHDINHKDASACYPPMMLLFFSVMSAISRSPLFFKSVILVFDIAVIPLMALLLRSRNINLKYLIIYALNPLVLVFIAGEGHLDAIQVFFICLSLYMFRVKKDGWGFLSLGCAVMSKYYAFILIPFFISRKNWKKSILLFLPFISYLPFLDSWHELFSSLMHFGMSMHYNDSVASLLRFLFGPNTVLISLILLAVCLVFIFLLIHDPIRSSYLALASLLILLPTLHPWYLVSLTPFLVLFPSRAWLYLHLGVMFTFPILSVECETGVFQELSWLKLFEYVPFFSFLILDFVKQRSFSSGYFLRPAESISVVVPVLNESENISGALASLKKEKGVLETIVVDGGSSDNTREIAEHQGVVVLESQQGRGLQIREGIRICRGDIVLILHADCRIISNTFERLILEMNNRPQCIGGSLGMHYETRSFKTRFISILNYFRARWLGVSFGDQGQFFRREALDIIGGFPEQMLMEDVELSLRLREKGLLCCIPRGIRVSKSRWDHMGFFLNFKKIVMLCLEYLIKRRLGLGDPSQKSFYRRYYADDSLNIKSVKS